MSTPQALLNRLDAIGQSVAQRPTALALIGLGSVGLELERLDAWSDLDFFLIVTPESKASYLAELDWLSAVAPIVYAFRNTIDGYKVLYEDGIFCEFAVFDETELTTAAFAPGRVVWKAPSVDAAIAVPQTKPQPADPPAADWLLGEALTNLVVGLGRDRRGEHLSAMRFIQSYAVDHTLALVAQTSSAETAPRDPFNLERRFEARYPNSAEWLPNCLQGYRRNRESALALLSFLDTNFAVNPAIKQHILDLAQG